MIKCDLREIKEHELLSSDDKRKLGRYHGSMFWDIPGFGKRKWVVATRIDLLENLPDDTADSDIVERCVQFLNTPPPRKKFQRRKDKPKYGSLELYSGKIIRKDDDVYISALLVTDQRSNKHFWGRGIVTTR
jgi:hypothetical protein